MIEGFIWSIEENDWIIGWKQLYFFLCFGEARILSGITLSIFKLTLVVER